MPEWITLYSLPVPHALSGARISVVFSFSRKQWVSETGYNAQLQKFSSRDGTFIVDFVSTHLEYWVQNA